MLEGKMRRYLTFGLVEVLLIVAGILIALSIDNWNSKKAQRKDELKIYQTISDRIQEDKNVIQNDIDYNNTYLVQFRIADRIISENDRSGLDTLLQIVPNLFKYSNSDKSSNIFQNLLNSGELKILENAEITSGLQELEGTYIYMSRMENIHFQIILGIISRDIIENMDLSTSKISSPEVFYSFQFHNLIVLIMDIMAEKNDVYQLAIRQIDNITGLIEKEVEK